jgi:hypothetical protein
VVGGESAEMVWGPGAGGDETGTVRDFGLVIDTGAH